MKELSDFHSGLLDVLIQTVDDDSLTYWIVRDVKNKEDVVIIGTVIEDEGQEVIMPLAILPNAHKNFFDKYDFDFYPEKEIPPPSVRTKKWWQFWF